MCLWQNITFLIGNILLLLRVKALTIQCITKAHVWLTALCRCASIVSECVSNTRVTGGSSADLLAMLHPTECHSPARSRVTHLLHERESLTINCETWCLQKFREVQRATCDGEDRPTLGGARVKVNGRKRRNGRERANCAPDVADMRDRSSVARRAESQHHSQPLFTWRGQGLLGAFCFLFACARSLHQLSARRAQTPDALCCTSTMCDDFGLSCCCVVGCTMMPWQGRNLMRTF